MVDIKGLDKGAVVAALYNGTRALGLGVFHDVGHMTAKQGGECFAASTRGYFDYLKGRPLKCDLSGDSFDEALYDRDAGKGSAARIIKRLRAEEPHVQGE